MEDMEFHGEDTETLGRPSVSRVGCIQRMQMREEGGRERIHRMNATGAFVPDHPPLARPGFAWPPNPHGSVTGIPCMFHFIEILIDG